MPRRRRHGRLGVFLNSRHVGHLNREASGAIDFRYARAWLAWEHTLPVSLSLPLREERYIGEPVIAVFDNLLPDNEGIRRRVAERVGAGGTDAFSLLAALGRDCVGALQFLPDDIQPGAAGAVEGRPVTQAEIAAMLGNLARNPLGVDGEDDFRISIAGAQEKTALLRAGERWLKPQGTTPTTHILKPQIGRLANGVDLSHSVENEYLCLTLTRAFGLPSAQVEMADFEGRRSLIVERFDRLWTDGGRLLRVPQEDCCQALSVPWSLKYENQGGPGIRSILELLAGSDHADQDRRAFLKATIVFWLLGATDGHAKNFSLFLSPGGGYRLAPLYDGVSAQPSIDAYQIRRSRMKLAMAVGDRRHYGVGAIAARHFIQSADQAGMARGAVTQIIDELLDTGARALDETLSGLPGDFPQDISGSIVTAVRTRLDQLARDRSSIKGARSGPSGASPTAPSPPWTPA